MSLREQEQLSGALDSGALRLRWTTELTSLRQRETPTDRQAQRIRDLQSFLAFLDPLRKYEFEWQAIPGFKRKLANELAAQTTTCDQDYRKHLLAKILAVLVGGSVAEPGRLCSRVKEAQRLCADHGESWVQVLDELRTKKLIRKDISGGLSLSSPGANLLEWAVSTVAAPQENVRAPSTQLYDRLGVEAKRAVGAVKLASIATAGESDDIEPRTTSRPPPHQIVAEMRLPTWTRYPPRHQSATPTAGETIQNTHTLHSTMSTRMPTHISPTNLRVLAESTMKKQKNAYAALHLLIQKGVVGECVCTYQRIEEEPFTVWECSLSLPEIRADAFKGQGLSQAKARTEAANSVMGLIVECS